MKTMFKDTLILFLITLIAGLGLGVVYNITKEPRAEQEEKTKIAAYKDVMPEMADYEEVKSVDKNAMQKFLEDKNQKNESENHITPIKAMNASIDEIVCAKNSAGEEIGYIVTVTDQEAYGGSLQMTVGILKDKTVKGISFLTLKETPGLGMKAKEDAFRKQFQNKQIDFFEYSKNGVTKENQIDAISSATITSNAVTHGVNAAIYSVDYLLENAKEVQ